jgi:hypothetical protein
MEVKHDKYIFSNYSWPTITKAGYWQISKDLHIYVQEKPKWIHAKMMLIWFGWKWIDKPTVVFK